MMLQRMVHKKKLYLNKKEMMTLECIKSLEKEDITPSVAKEIKIGSKQIINGLVGKDLHGKVKGERIKKKWKVTGHWEQQ